ncbi:MAG: hypothetical protein ABSD99_07815 [Candidatus Bathyarchaeia archaeon]
MLTFPTILGRSLRIVGGLLLADGLAAYGLTFLSYRFIDTLGDSMLIEVAVLFILAGLLDFSSSIGAVEFRKTILGSKQEYSSSTHKEAERKATVFFLGGVILLLMLIVMALYAGS